MKLFFFPLMLFLIFLFSCHEENDCDNADYANPEITLLSPEGPEIEVPANSEFTLEFSVSAEAGLNTFTMVENNSDYEMPVKVFTRGEKQVRFNFTYYYWTSGEVEFVLHDLCDNATSIVVNLTVKQPVY